MSSSLKLEIITPERVFYRGEVKMVVVRTFLGEEGFLPGHLPAVKLLDTGELAIQEEGSEKLKIASISGGFVDVKDGIIIYTDRAEWAEEIDKAKAEAAKAAAEEWLKDHDWTTAIKSVPLHITCSSRKKMPMSVGIAIS